MAINNYDLGRDVINTEVLTKTNYEITFFDIASSTTSSRVS